MTQDTAPEAQTTELGVAVPFVIEEGAVRQFARAALMADAESVTFGSPTPVTFLAAVAHWMPAEAKVKTGFDRARLLHGSEEFHLPEGPPTVGMRLMARERIAERYEKAGGRGGLMRFAVVVTDFTDAGDGRLVARTRRTLIERASA